MGLFDRKYCDICGEKIGLLGNRKLENGNLCKKCASRLSPWFSERRQSTVDDIKEQLAYREENRAEAAKFHTTRSYGDYTKLLLDEDARKFTVTSARNLEEANPDILDYSQVTGCSLDVSESRDEEKRQDKDGNMVSYNPPRYTYSYSFRMMIQVNHKYFDEMRFSLTNNDIETFQKMPTQITLGTPFRLAAASRAVGRPERTDTTAVSEFTAVVQEANEIRKVLMTAREEAREEAAPKKPVICPACGATTTPDANGCCEYCGTALKG